MYIWLSTSSFDQLKEDLNNGTDSTVESVMNSSSTWDSFVQLLGLVILLIVVLAAAYYTTRFVGGIKQGQLRNSNFDVVDAYRIGPNKVIQIVRIANKYIVIAISKDTISYITELEESQVYIRDPQSPDKQSFKQTLEKLRNLHK